MDKKKAIDGYSSTDYFKVLLLRQEKSSIKWAFGGTIPSTASHKSTPNKLTSIIKKVERESCPLY
jgi:phage gp29-like protein